MTRSNLFATTALSLCLSSHAGIGAAQTVTAEDLAAFAPPVQECLTSASAQACLPQRAVVEDCAADISRPDCDMLLASGVIDDPDMMARAQDVLRDLDDTLHELEADADVDNAEAEAEDDVIAEEDLSDAEPEALPEPEAAPEEDPAPESEIAQEPEEQPAPEPDVAQDQDEPAPEPEVAQEPEAEPEDAAEPDVAQEELEATPEEEPATELADDAAPEQPDTELEDLSRALEELARDEDTAPDVTEEGTAEETPEDAEARLAAEIEAERALEEERRRMIEEAEAMADEAPELIVEDVPEEELVAPVEAPRELDATQQAAIEELMQSPNISSALGVLGAMLGTAPETETPEEEADTRPLAARLLDEAEEDALPEESEDVIEEQITRDQIRTSRDDFESRLTLDFDTDTQARADRSARDRRDLERAGLAALGALAVGMIVNQNRVVARSDERVVVDQGGGALQLWRDDDSILLQDGSTRRIERYDDGSTRTRWTRADGSETITIRDATGRVLRRERVLTDGTIVVLLDDTQPSEAIDVSILPPPRTRELRISPRSDPELAIALLREAEADARALDRRFSLRQIRESREVRELVPLLSPDLITFETNRANVRPEEAAKLLQVGRLMERLITEDPREMFLIEGHTDATGPAAFNLALSDRRAESVALALTEFFDIPPENLIVQGYGKRYLRIPTLDSEVRNRRVAIRRITPLLWQ